MRQRRGDGSASYSANPAYAFVPHKEMLTNERLAGKGILLGL